MLPMQDPGLGIVKIGQGGVEVVGAGVGEGCQQVIIQLNH